MAAFAGEMSGSSPEPDAVTASAGIEETGTWSNAEIAFCAAAMLAISVGLVGPRFEAAEYSGSQPKSFFSPLTTASDGRGWKYCGSGLPLASTNSWQSRLEPTTWPL